MYPYWLFKMQCIVAEPFRIFYNGLPFNTYPKFLLPVYLLFKNDYQRAWVISQIFHESGKDFNGNPKSRLATEFNNLFGMGFHSSKYVRSAWNSGKKGEPNFAVYSTVYNSVYDYYYMFFSVKPDWGRMLQTFLPASPFSSDSEATRNFFANVAGGLQAYKYFAQDAGKYSSDAYAINLRLPWTRYKADIAFTRVWFVVCFVVVLFLSVFSLRFIREGAKEIKATKKDLGNVFTKKKRF